MKYRIRYTLTTSKWAAEATKENDYWVLIGAPVETMDAAIRLVAEHSGEDVTLSSDDE